MKSINQYLLDFIPERYSDNEESLRKARLFVIVSFLTPVFSSYYLVICTYFNMPNVLLGMIFNVLTFPILPFLLKHTKIPLRWLGNLYIAIGTIGVSWCALMTGGLDSSVLPWLSLLPLNSMLLVDKNSGWFWTVTTVIFIAIVGLLAYNGTVFMNETQEGFKHFFVVGNLIGLGVILFLIALVFENTKNDALDNLASRNMQLAAEKKRSDELLLNILPFEIVSELKQNGFSKARHFQNVTVLFTDFIDFTHISEGMDPEELVGEIDLYFKAFDEIIDRNGLEKIKTIGDAYLAVGGLPHEFENHALQTIQAAKEILAFTQDRMAAGGKFNVRIGINSGPCVAGIVGLKKFAYDVWGDTVNTASRLESNGEAGKINISGSTYNLVCEHLSCIYRGKISAKGKGEIDMYFVEV
jgi:class 3 adenylate cyclase